MTRDLDELLQEAGDRWRASVGSPSPPDIGLVAKRGEAQLGRQRVARAAMSVGAIALLAIVTITAGGIGPLRLSSGAAGPFEDWLVRAGDAVVAVGGVAEGEDGLRICRQALVRFGTAVDPCSVVAVPLVGVSIDELPGWIRGEGRAHTDGYVRVLGTWTGQELAVESVEPTSIPGPRREQVPCPAPPGGWLGGSLSPLEQESAIRPLVDEVEANPHLYAGLWTADLDPTDPPVAIVGTIEDVDSTRSRLQALYPYDLCVIQVPHSRDVLEATAQRVRDLDPVLVAAVDVPANRVQVQAPVLTDGLAERLADEAPRIALDPLVVPTR